jgi:hypothetical protein
VSEARAHRAATPELRIALHEVTTGAELIRRLAREGALQTAPEGEHDYNEHIAPFILDVASGAEEKRMGTETKQQAECIVGFTADMGFRLFASHYRAQFAHRGKPFPQPITVMLAVPATDARIHKTPKGRMLDYVVDTRRNVLQRALSEELTVYDWMEKQMIARSDSKGRVRAAILRIHREVIAKAKRKRL